jgi:hypothetical protein
MPAGKAIAMAAMPTAVLMGMGFTPTLAVADDQPTTNSKLADEYKECVAALEGAEASPSASPSPSASESPSESEEGSQDDSADDASGSQDSADKGGSSDGSSDSGSDDKPAPEPSASSAPAPSQEKPTSPSSGDTPTASPSPSETSKNVLETIGDAIKDVFDGDDSADTAAGASPSPSASPSASAGGSSSDSGSSGSSGSSQTSGKGDSAGDAVKDTTDPVTDTVKDTVEGAEEAAEDAAKDTEEAAGEAAGKATASPSPSASAGTAPEDCLAATDDEGGVDNKVPVADDPWYLQASSLLLKGSDYQGVVEVKTSGGAKKKVLKYVISDGTDIGDLHQLVNDKNSGKVYHVQAAKGSTSTIREGDTIMYTESISGNLFGLIPVTFSPEHPPPLNIPLIYFTNVKVTQAAQFGGTLHIPGMQVYTTDK